MFRIRRVPDDNNAANAAAVHQVQAIMRARFPALVDSEVDSLPDRLRDPVKYRFRPILLVAEGTNDAVRGFALLLHAPDLRFCYLDFVAAAPGKAGGGVGGALYERVREEALALGCLGIFFECLPDDPALSSDAEIRGENVERLRFYERYGARPIVNTAYETPITPGDDNPPYLVFDALGQDGLPSRDEAQAIVRAILERKYGELCPPEYIRMVVESFRDETISLRAPRYVRRKPSRPVRALRRLPTRIPMVVNDKHDIHHVRERGYVESPVRITSILKELEQTDHFERLNPRRFSDAHIYAVHDGRLVDYLRRACAMVGNDRSVYPYVFPIRNALRPPKELPLRAGYFCIDTFTPINSNAYLAARRGVDCTLTAAERVLEGQRFAYALVRPPGHHAERRAFGGFCYFNNAAIAAHYLSNYGRVALLDIDYHHGNGSQDIFYERSDVLTVSIHGHPSFAYPYFSGFKQERGSGPGTGYNWNYPLAELISCEQYYETLTKALRRVARFAPRFLVVATGFDTAAGDPTGSWSNRGDDFSKMGQAIAELGYPTLVVQEGGYRVRTLGSNARRFFEGLWSKVGLDAESRTLRQKSSVSRSAVPTIWREDVAANDVESIRTLTAAADTFTTEEVRIAAELIAERLVRGLESGYYFCLAERGERLIGYACFGPIPGTASRYDLYWIVVDAHVHREGIGAELLRRVEAAIAQSGGSQLYVDTSDRHAKALAFYRRTGFRRVAHLPDFYRDGDGKVILMKFIDHGQQAVLDKRTVTEAAAAGGTAKKG